MDKYLNYIGYIALIVSIFLFGLKSLPTEMGLAISACALYLAFVNIDKFRKFKGAGFEAELKQTIDDANATIAQLKAVAHPLIETNLIILAKANRLPDSPFKKSHEIYDLLLNLQTKLELQDKNLEKAKLTYLNAHAWEMVKNLSHEIDQSSDKIFSEDLDEIIGKRSYDKTPNIESLLILLKDRKLSVESQNNLIKIKDFYNKYNL